jgi:hypothetical protein
MTKPQDPKELPLQVAGIAWRQLQKGDVIPAEKVDEMWMVLYGTTRKKDDRFVLQSIKEWLEAARASIGDQLVFKQEQGNLVVLTDEQAVNYLNGQALAGLRKHRSNTRRMFTAIDEDQLDKHSKDQLAVNQARHALIASAADGARRQAVKLLRTGAKLPKLMPPEL